MHQDSQCPVVEEIRLGRGSTSRVSTQQRELRSQPHKMTRFGAGRSTRSLTTHQPPRPPFGLATTPRLIFQKCGERDPNPQSSSLLLPIASFEGRENTDKQAHDFVAGHSFLGQASSTLYFILSACPRYYSALNSVLLWCNVIIYSHSSLISKVLQRCTR